MQKERTEEQLRLLELNKRFLQEVENGAGWNDLKGIMEDMKDIAKNLEHLPATVLSMNNYPLNKTNEAG